MSKERLTLTQTAKRLKISRQRLHQLIMDGRATAHIDELTGWLYFYPGEVERLERREKMRPGPKKKKG